jgi:hypothetical protein
MESGPRQNGRGNGFGFIDQEDGESMFAWLLVARRLRQMVTSLQFNWVWLKMGLPCKWIPMAIGKSQQ